MSNKVIIQSYVKSLRDLQKYVSVKLCVFSVNLCVTPSYEE